MVCFSPKFVPHSSISLPYYIPYPRPFSVCILSAKKNCSLFFFERQFVCTIYLYIFFLFGLLFLFLEGGYIYPPIPRIAIPFCHPIHDHDNAIPLLHQFIPCHPYIPHTHFIHSHWFLSVSSCPSFLILFCCCCNRCPCCEMKCRIGNVTSLSLSLGTPQLSRENSEFHAISTTTLRGQVWWELLVLIRWSRFL